jgi:hypothetical protein
MVTLRAYLTGRLVIGAAVAIPAIVLFLGGFVFAAILLAAIDIPYCVWVVYWWHRVSRRGFRITCPGCGRTFAESDPPGGGLRFCTSCGRTLPVHAER